MSMDVIVLYVVCVDVIVLYVVCVDAYEQGRGCGLWNIALSCLCGCL